MVGWAPLVGDPTRVLVYETETLDNVLMEMAH
jgi:hypothetical protein